LRDVLFSGNSKSDWIPLTRKNVGLSLRKLREFWKIGCVLSLLRFACSSSPANPHEHFGKHEIDSKTTSIDKLEIEAFDRVREFISFVEKNQLNEIWNVKPLLNVRLLIFILYCLN